LITKTDIDHLQKSTEEQTSTPPTTYNTTTVIVSNGIYYLCNTKCPNCGRKKILKVDIQNFLINGCLGEWWVAGAVGPDGSMSNIPCPNCWPDKADVNNQNQRRKRNREQIILPGLEAMKKYTLINEQYRAKTAQQNVQNVAPIISCILKSIIEGIALYTLNPKAPTK